MPRAEFSRWVLAALCIAAPGIAAAADLTAFTSVPAPGGGQIYSLPVQTLLLLTALTFLPAVLLLMTGFTRIVIVLSLLRHALGTQSSPPNQVLVGLSLFLTLFVMGAGLRPDLRRRLPALRRKPDQLQ